MKGFEFDLQAVLDARVAQERRCQVVVAGIERRRAELEERIREMQRALVGSREDLREHLGASAGAVDLRGVRLQASASLGLLGKAQRAVFELAGVHRRLDAARLDLLRAATRRKAVEALRDRRLEAWKREQKRREDAALDELNVMRAGAREDAA